VSEGNAGKKVVVEHRLGRIEVPEEDVIHFEGGLPGFDQAHSFAVLPHDVRGPLFWLVCLDDAQLAFVVVDPRELFPGYQPQIEAHQLRQVAAEAASEAELLALVTIRGEHVTVNLAAPLLLNLAARRGIQVILEGEDHPLRQPLRRAAALPPGTARASSEAEIQP